MNVVSGTHDHGTALLMARMSDLAYCDHEFVNREAPKYLSRHAPGVLAGAVQSFSASSTDSQCFLCECNGVVVVSFRGTETDSPRDIATDAKMSKSEGPYRSRHSKVHRGFWLSAKSLIHETDLISCLHDLTYEKNKSLIFTGHSLGGALATLMSAYLTNGGWSGISCYTYGSPRVGNRGFAAIYDRECPHYRYVYQNDVVARIPWVFGSYRHVGELYFIDSEYNLHVNPGFIRYFWMRYGGLKNGIFNWASSGVRDHSMIKYIAATSAIEFKRKE